MADELRLLLLGGLDMTRGGFPITGFRSHKAQALLCYLAVTGRPHLREALVGLLWGDLPEADARTSLRVVLSNLRHLIGDHVLITRDTVAFNRTAPYFLDVEHFEANLQRPASAAFTPDVDRLRAAVELYRGDFLQGFSLRDAPEFDEWVATQRERLQHMAAQTLRTLADYSTERHDYAAALAYLTRLLRFEPWAEEVHRQVMVLLARCGQRSAALAHYHTCCRLLEDELGVEPDAETTALCQQIQAGELDREPGVAPGVQDWGEAPDLGSFYGRETEVATLERWLVADRCRLVALLGMGGAGKTALAARLVERLAPHFDCVLWRSVLNAPPLADLLRGWLQVLSAQHLTTLPASLDEQLALLLNYLRQQRCLLVLDNLESLLQEGERAGSFRPGYAAYGQLLQRLGQSRHQSCLLLTSRERPADLARLEGATAPVRALHLSGLAEEAGQALLQERGLGGAAEEQAALVDHYSGNPLALKLVAETIQDVYGGDISAFLGDETPIFDDVRDVLDQQFARLSELEQELLFWLAIEREAVSVPQLQRDLVRVPAPRAMLEAVRSLQRRSLLEQRGAGFTLQNVVTEYLTDRLVLAVCEELETEVLDLLMRYALLKAQAKEYLRQSQARLILQPVAHWLQRQFGPAGVARKVRQLLHDLCTEAPRTPGYAAGNLLNLLVHLGYELRGYDFSRLSVWQAYLRGVRVPGINFTEADLADSVFTDTFRSVNAVAFHPDGHLLAAGGGDGAVRLWQVGDGQLAAIYSGHTTFVWSVAFSPDGRLLASGGSDQAVRVWDAHTGQTLHILHGHADAVQSVAFSPNGATLASSGDQTMRLWDVHTGQALHILQGHTQGVRSVAFSPDGATLASGSYGHRVRLWDVRTGQILHTLHGHTEEVMSVAFSPDGMTLASGSYDQTVRLWNAHTGEPLHILRGHTEGVNGVAFSPDGATLASSGNDHTIRLWDVHARHVIRSFLDHTQGVNGVAFSPDGATLASSSGDQTVRLWDTRNAHVLYTLHGYTCTVYAVAFSPGGQFLASGHHDQLVRIWDARTWQIRHTLSGHTRWVMAVAFSPDGAILASASHDHTVRLWDARTGQTLHILHGHTNAVESVAFSPDGATLASGSHDHTVRLWDVRTGRLRDTLHGHTGNIKSVAFSPGGMILASGSRDQTVRLWDIDTGQTIHTLHGHTSVIDSVAFSPDGATLASGSWDQTVRVWDVHTGQAVRLLTGHTHAVYSVAFSPDGQRLASGGTDQSVRLWDARSGRLIQTLQGHTNWVRPVAFSPDGTLLASGSYDETIRLWDVRTGTVVHTLEADGPYVGMNITGATGLTEAQKAALKALGAVEDEGVATTGADQRSRGPSLRLVRREGGPEDSATGTG